MHRAAFSFVLFALVAAAPVVTLADATIRYEGADELLLVGRPNSAGTNVRGARLHSRALPTGHVAELLSPLVSAGLQGCSLDDVREISISAERVPDRIGDTMTRLHGLGLYMNLPLADRVNHGTFYLAPFVALKIALVGNSGPLQTIELFEFTRVTVDKPHITEGSFLDARTADVETSIAAFAKARVPVAVRKAFASRCPAA